MKKTLCNKKNINSISFKNYTTPMVVVITNTHFPPFPSIPPNNFLLINKVWATAHTARA